MVSSFSQEEDLHDLYKRPIGPPTSSLANSPPIPALGMTSFDTYSPKSTSISFPWPPDVTGLERIALSAQGDLQRVLSAFFARPIVIQLVYSHTYFQETLSSPLTPLHLPSPEVIAAASPSQPIVQTRQVLLQCAGKTVCTATSTVRITSPACAQLFLEEKYAIGQMFRRLEKLPAFHLLSVGLGPVDDDMSNEKSTPLSQFFSNEARKDDQLWRKYKLVIPDFECEILEVFPSRDMFLYGDGWLTDTYLIKPRSESPYRDIDVLNLAVRTSRIQQNLIVVIGLGFLLILVFELSRFVAGPTGTHLS